MRRRASRDPTSAGSVAVGLARRRSRSSARATRRARVSTVDGARLLELRHRQRRLQAARTSRADRSAPARRSPENRSRGRGSLGSENSVLAVNWKIPVRVSRPSRSSREPARERVGRGPDQLPVVFGNEPEQPSRSILHEPRPAWCRRRRVSTGSRHVRERLFDAPLRRRDRLPAFTVTSFVPLFTVNGARRARSRRTRSRAPHPEQLAARLRDTAKYQYYLCRAPCADNDSGSVALTTAGQRGRDDHDPGPGVAGKLRAEDQGEQLGASPRRCGPIRRRRQRLPVHGEQRAASDLVSVAASPSPPNQATRSR